jgi:hypothetical protein
MPGGATVHAGAIHTTKQAGNLSDNEVFSRPESDNAALRCIHGFGAGSATPQGRRHNLFCVDIPSPTRCPNQAASGFQFNKERETMTTKPQPTSGDIPSLDPTTPTLDDFAGWVLATHGDTFDAMDTTEDDAYRAHLASFGRTNTALQLLTQFRAAHAAKVSETGGAA